MGGAAASETAYREHWYPTPLTVCNRLRPLTAWYNTVRAGNMYLTNHILRAWCMPLHNEINPYQRVVRVSEVQPSRAPQRAAHSQLAYRSVTCTLHPNHVHCGVYRGAHSTQTMFTVVCTEGHTAPKPCALWCVQRGTQHPNHVHCGVYRGAHSTQTMCTVVCTEGHTAPKPCSLWCVQRGTQHPNHVHCGVYRGAHSTQTMFTVVCTEGHTAPFPQYSTD